MSAIATKESWATYMRDYRAKNPNTFRNINLKGKYNLSLDSFNEMLQKQNNVCAICKQPETKLDHRTRKLLPLCVDHCHTTDTIRGLLCADCNRALGMFQDSQEILASAIKYLNAGA